MSKQPKRSIEETCQKEMPEFVAEVSGLDLAALNTRLAGYAKDVEAVQDASEADEELERTREQLNQLSAPYREAKKALKLKIRYIISLTKESK